MSSVRNNRFTIGLVLLLLVSAAYAIFAPHVLYKPERAKRILMGASLRAIGQCWQLYASDEARRPMDLDDLIDTGCVSEEMLSSPRNPGGGRSVVFIPGLSPDAPWSLRLVLAYEEFPGIKDDAVVLFVGGYTEEVSPLSEVEELVAKTREYVRQREELNAAAPEAGESATTDEEEKAAKRRRIANASLRSLGISILIYAMDHKDAFPPNLDVLVETGDVSEGQLKAPGDPSGGRSYVYISGLKARDPKDLVVAYEDHAGLEDGAHVLFVDGRVEFIEPRSKVEELAAKTREYLRERNEGKSGGAEPPE